MSLDQVVIILYQPQDVVNVAAIIRGMSNFGLRQLRLVEPAAFDAYRIEGIAHRTGPIIEAVDRYPTLEAAIADCSLVLGTSGRPRAGDRNVLTPREAAPALLAGTSGGRTVAVLFGPEQDGLPNAALDACHAILSIPTDPGNHSLNLAQAALVVMYELFVTAEPRGTWADPESLATGAQREAMFQAVEGLLVALYPTGPAGRLEASMSRLRTMLMRSAPRPEETEALANLLRHAARRLGAGLPQRRQD